ncbi:hypothetical protein ACFWNG_32515 [Streptomyces sp. NPDC058391]|uniref:hypothetical protein n=1 Tax=Streptomyces sp. NPDC058391 TaxID=3346476 RepID=UPI0036632C12
MSRPRFFPHALTYVRRRPSLCVSAALVLLLAGWAVAGGLHVIARGDSRAVPMLSPSPSASPSAPASPPPSPSPSPSESVGTMRLDGVGQSTEADPDQVLAERLAPILKTTTASLSVAVLDLENGHQARYGVRTGTTYDTASIVKVDILVALLLKAQDQDRRLTAQEKTYAVSMIRVSDNASADALWSAIGGAPGLDAANRRLGLTGTTAGSNGLWGLTQTTATDQVALLSVVFGEDSELAAASRSYVRELMGGTAEGQDWGVSAAGTAPELKNGWLPRTATGLWDINSIGRISVDGHSCLLAVLSGGSVSKQAGVSLVEKAAKAAAAVISA